MNSLLVNPWPTVSCWETVYCWHSTPTTTPPHWSHVALTCRCCFIDRFVFHPVCVASGLAFIFLWPAAAERATHSAFASTAPTNDWKNQCGHLSADDCASKCLPDLGRALMSQPPGDLVSQPRRLSRRSASSGEGGRKKIPETTEQHGAGCGCPGACARDCVSVCARIAVMRWFCRSPNWVHFLFSPLVYLWCTFFFSFGPGKCCFESRRPLVQFPSESFASHLSVS